MRRLEEEGLEPDGESTFFIGTWMACCLIVLTIFFDAGGEAFTRFLKRKAGEEEEEETILRTHGQCFLAIWRRFNSELTALGFLAFTSYVFAEAGIYEWVQEKTEYRHYPGDEEYEAAEAAHEASEEGEVAAAGAEGGETSRRVLLGLLGRVLEEGTEGSIEGAAEGAAEGAIEAASGGEEGEALVYDKCKRYLPSEFEWLEEHLETVHMAIFIAMALYFILVTISIYLHQVRLPFGSYTSASVSNPKFANRRKWLLQSARNWPKVKALAESDALVAKALDDNQFDYCGFVYLSSSEVVNLIIDFPPSAWTITLVYSIIIAILSDHACAAEHQVKLVLQIVQACGYGYYVLRIVVCEMQIQRGGTLWPGSVLDRYVLWVVGPCISGFAPWSPNPSRKIAISVQQAWMWFQLYRVAFMVSDEHGVLYEDDPHPALHTDLALVSTFAILAASLMWPYYIEVFSLPPFANIENSESKLVEVLQARADFERKGGDTTAPANPELPISVSST